MDNEQKEKLKSLLNEDNLDHVNLFAKYSQYEIE
jgi:hypothetical protein